MGAKIMTLLGIPTEYLSDFQGQAESEIGSKPGVHHPALGFFGAQIPKHHPLSLTDKSAFSRSSMADFYFFSLNKVKLELEEIREEVQETCAVADDVEPIPESAYNETFELLKQIHRNVPIPDMMWLEDGGIGLEWRPPDGIATMSLYGDGLVVYGAFF